MPKVLAQAGTSLADIYDIEGSVAGVDQLLTHDVQVVHEMGDTIFSERISSFVRSSTTAAIAQNVGFDTEIADLPAGVSRILSVQVTGNATARLSKVMVAIREPSAGREVAILAWDSTLDDEVPIRIEVEGSLVDAFLYRPTTIVNMPNILIGTGQPQRVSDIAFRGLASGFGAGTIVLTALIHVAFSNVEGIGSIGLPVPSW